ncbi:MAG: 6-bladed beta-propeller, partial [Longimicrobiales bacterium]|nr:6-bladed beta-propeller [Longimicrobiales bacterium]
RLLVFLPLLLLPPLVRPLVAQDLPVEFELVGTIGVSQGDPEEEFGQIKALTRLDTSDIILILDPYRGRLSAFDRDGTFLASTGRLGQGPGEFRVPRALSSMRERIFVYDPANIRISEYAWNAEGAELALQRESRAPFEAKGMCAAEDRLYFLAYHEGRIVHQLDPDTGELVSFGSPFRSGHPNVEWSSTNGLIGCNEETRSVYVGGFVTPIVRRYDLNGELIWEAEIPDFPAARITPNEYGGVRMRMAEGEDRSLTLVSLAMVPTVGLVVQYADAAAVRIRAMEDLIDVRTSIFSLDDGSLLASGITSLPRIDLVDGEFAYSRGNDPFPRVKIYRWSR